MEYISTRGMSPTTSSAGAIRTGMAPDGGLYIPTSIPTWRGPEPLSAAAYQGRAAWLLAEFLTDYTPGEITGSAAAAYSSEKFPEAVAPVRTLTPSIHVLELWHGPTSAFKDMALQLLPHLLRYAVAKGEKQQRTLILVATSGDTGKAALEGFRDVPGTEIVVFYPARGVSPMQQWQMVTQEGNNVHVVAVEGNFDDAQRGVKALFASRDFNAALARRGLQSSSANSINWGRLVPQLVYYFSAYTDLVARSIVRQGEPVDIVVPTGNFGNILAAFYALLMGLPVHKLVCAANANNVLVDFLRTGIYDRRRPFVKTLSPSMDILVSSNVERLLFELSGRDSRAVASWMESLAAEGAYDASSLTEQLTDIFWTDWAGDDETLQTIGRVYQEHGYLLDPHTAVAWSVYEKYAAARGSSCPAILVSTASPFKFNRSVALALLGEEGVQGKDEFELVDLLARHTGWPVPVPLRDLKGKSVRHKTVCSPGDMGKTVLSLLDQQAK
ncbi:MAG: threonine synthase [Firmicutes bacterium]|jgi:threonine synthase|nr:threonine synthase [Bacillota bacterium]